MNLATGLLVDGFNGEYEQAVIVSNDADFAGAMEYVRDVLGLRVTLVNPDPGTAVRGSLPTPPRTSGASGRAT